MKVLNLYAGIGGNRKLWEDVGVTAVEINDSIAEYYRDQFPDDEVVVGDAHEYLRNHHDEYDFIWASPPCQTHSRVSKMMWDSEVKQNAGREPEYPDMRLYQEIIFLRNFFEGDWAVENVHSYHEPLITPQVVGRHYFWSNEPIPRIEDDIDLSGEIHGDESSGIEGWEAKYGFDLSGWSFSHRKDQILRNCTHPRVGKHVFEAVTGGRQATITESLEGVGGGEA